jgi:hypothetical protein
VGQPPGSPTDTPGRVTSGLAAGPGGGPVPAAHWDRVTESLINVRAPLRAKSLPSTFTPLFTEIDVRARMLPLNAVVVPSVAELPTCQ